MGSEFPEVFLEDCFSGFAGTTVTWPLIPGNVADYSTSGKGNGRRYVAEKEVYSVFGPREALITWFDKATCHFLDFRAGWRPSGEQQNNGEASCEHGWSVRHFFWLVSAVFQQQEGRGEAAGYEAQCPAIEQVRPA